MNTKKRNSFLYVVLRRTLVATKCVGLFPVDGIFQQSQRLRFNPLSLTIIMLFTIFTLKSFLTAVNIYQIRSEILSMRNIAELIRDSLHFLRMILLIQFAYNFNNINQSTLKFERKLHINENLVQKRCHYIFMLLHVNSLLTIVCYYCYIYNEAQVCMKNGTSSFKAFMVYVMYGIFKWTTFETWKGIFVLVMYTQQLYMTEIFDLYLIQMCVYMNGYFENFNRRVKANVKKGNDKKFVAWTVKSPNSDLILRWKILREEYVDIVRIFNILCHNLSGMTTLSFAQNIFQLWFMILQLLRRGQFIDLSKCDNEALEWIWSPYNLSRVAFLYFCSAILISRLLLTSFLTANVNHSSKKSALYLYETADTTSGNKEVERLLSHIHNATIAFDGWGFFHVTRSMVFSMVGIIATYEIMLLQFATDIRRTTDAVSNYTNAFH